MSLSFPTPPTVVRLFTLLAFLSVALLSATCTHSSATIKNMEGTWLHAHEEDQEGVEVYRPNTYTFRPSRGRTGFAFDHNGLFTQYDIAPTDGLEGREGTWKMEGNDIIRISLDDKQNPDYRLQIVSLENKVLKVRRLE